MTGTICLGRVCIKTRGREKGKVCVILKIEKEKNMALVDGDVKRRKCNIKHLEPQPTILEIKKDGTTEEIKKALKEAGYKLEEKKMGKERKKPKSERPRKERKGARKKERKERKKKAKKTEKEAKQ